MRSVMKDYSLINHFNAVKACEFLLVLDISTVVEVYRLDASSWVNALQESLEHYKNHIAMHFQEREIKEVKPADIKKVHYAFTSLKNAANELINILTEEGKKQLVDYLKHQTRDE